MAVAIGRQRSSRRFSSAATDGLQLVDGLDERFVLRLEMSRQIAQVL